MGCCCDSQQKAQDAVILTQIKRAVQEQEEIMNAEGDSLEQELIDEAREEPLQQKAKEAPQIEMSEDDEDKSDKKKSKKKQTKKDDNYLKVIEYKSIKINHFILTSDETQGQYELIVNASHFEFYYDVKCKAIIVTDQDKPFTIKPYTYAEASCSNYDVFFRIDTYFTIDQTLNSNKQSFDQLLEVTRAIPKPQPVLPQVFQVKNQIKEAQSPAISPYRSPKKSRANQMQTELLTEMLEIIHVFDLELCPRFHQLLFALMVQQQLPLLKPYYINISDAYFLFDSKPSLDKCQIQKIAIFYEYWNYSLYELHDYLIKNEMQLSHLSFLKLSYDLIQIFHNTYKSYFYRCNFTLKSLFYITKSKKFKLQSFARLQTLIKFTSDPEQAEKLLQVVNEQKLKYFIRDFDKDLGAVCDLILLFKDVSNPLAQIKKVRRKKKNSDAHHVKYQEFAQSVLDFEEKDKLIYELIRLKSQQIGRDQFDYIVEEIKTLLITLEYQIADETSKYEKNKEKNEQRLVQSDVHQESQQIDEDEENEARFLLTFDHHIPRETKPQKKPPTQPKKSKHSKEQKEQKDDTQELDAFNQMKYASLFYFDNFLDSSDTYLQLCTSDTLKAYTFMLQAVVKGSEFETKQQQINAQQSLLQEATKILMASQQHLIQDSFSYYLLIDIITKQHDKSVQLLNQLRFIIQQQNYIRKKWIRPRLTTTCQYNGIIEMRKAIILDLYYIELYMKKHLYNQALSIMQHIVTQQLRFNLKAYLLYGQTVFMNGILCQRMMQYVSSMLNLEVCRLVFTKFFPTNKIVYTEEDTGKQVEIDQQETNKQYRQKMIYFSNEASENYNVLEFTLGQVYSNLGEKENALKCLREVKALRERKYEQFSDEVIEVVLQILKIHVEQEESGAAMEICQEYFFKFKQAGKQNVILKSRLIARLQLIMAAIYECNGMIISALRYYQKANRTFILSKNNSYVRQLHILQKISKIVEVIKQRAYQAMTLDANYNYDIENYIGKLSEKVKPYFNNQFISQVRNDSVLYNPSLMRKYVRANQCLRNKELQSAMKRYQRIHRKFKKQKVDECYGFTLEKIGTVQLIDKNLKNGLSNLQMAIEVHDRYLEFPLKETHILTCNIYILIGHALEQNNKEVQKQLNILDDFVQSVQDQLQWTQVPYHSLSNKFAVLANKLGRSVLYQLNSLWEKIEKYQKLRFKFGQHLNDNQRLSKIATTFLNKKFNKLSDYSSQLCATRSSCLFGLFVKGRRRQAVSQAPSQLQVEELIKIHQKNEQKKKKSTKIIQQQNEQSIVIKQSHQNTQVSLKSDNIQINLNQEKEDIQSASNKRSQPPTALVSPLLSPINRSPEQLLPKPKKMQKIDPFAKVIRKK